MGGALLSPRCRCRKASVALLDRSMASSGSISPFSFISFPIQLPVRKVKSGKLWWTVPLKEGGHMTPQSVRRQRLKPTGLFESQFTWWWSFSSGWRQTPASSCGWCSPPTGTSQSWWRRSAASPEGRSRRLEGTSRRPERCRTWWRGYWWLIQIKRFITVAAGL